MSRQEKRCVIFDMDGVLVDSAGPHLESWRRLADENGTFITDAQFSATFGRQNRDIIPILFGKVSESQIRALADRKEAIYRDLVRASPPIVPGAVDLIHDLIRLEFRLAVGSSGPSDNIKLVLSAMGVSSLIEVVVSGDDVTRGKPDPQVFQMAADRLGVPPPNCVVVEDAPVGVEAARNAGCKVAAVLIHHPASAFHKPDIVVNRLSDLTANAVLDLL